jgi:hypothetical protein
MIMLAETVDAVIGIDTHRDHHEVEIADPAGKPIAALRIGNDSAGFAHLLATIAKVVPGPQGSCLHRGHPWVWYRAGAGAGRCRAAGDRV